MAAPPIARLLDHHLLFLPVHEQQEEGRAREEDAVHDAKGERRLQHRAFLVDVEAEGRVPAEAIRAQGDVEGAVVAEVAAVGFGDAAQVVDARDQGPDEEDVDEADEVRRAPGRFAAEERQEAPYRCEGGDYEEHSEVGVLDVRTGERGKVGRTGRRLV